MIRPEFLAVNSAGKLPVLVDGDFILTESVAIVLYLAEKHGRPPLLVGAQRNRRSMRVHSVAVVVNHDASKNRDLQRLLRHLPHQNQHLHARLRRAGISE
jgi:glutathione S-transferase